MIEKIQSFISQHPLLTGIIGLGVMLLFVLILFLPSTSQELSKTSSQDNTNIKNNSHNTNSSSQTKNQSIPWIVGQNEDYIIAFPSSWQQQTRSVAGGGTTVYLKAPTYTENSPFPLLLIETLHSTIISPEQQAKELSNLPLTKAVITFKSEPAIKLSGPLPLNPSTMHENKVYIFFSA